MTSSYRYALPPRINSLHLPTLLLITESVRASYSRLFSLLPPNDLENFTNSFKSGNKGDDSVEDALTRYRQLQDFAQQLQLAASGQLRLDLAQLQGALQSIPDDFENVLNFFGIQQEFHALRCKTNPCDVVSSTLDFSLRESAANFISFVSNALIIFRASRRDLNFLVDLTRNFTESLSNESFESADFVAAVSSADQTLLQIRALQISVEKRLSNAKNELQKIKEQQVEFDRAVGIAQQRAKGLVRGSGWKVSVGVVVALVMVVLVG